MRPVSLWLSVLTLIAAVTLTSRAGTQTIQVAEGDPGKQRLIDMLPVGTVVQSSFVDGSHVVIVLNEAGIRKARQSGQPDYYSPQNGMHSPWKVVSVGADHVRLEPFLEAADNERRISWIAIASSRIRCVIGE